jgi:hypothetical protein
MISYDTNTNVVTLSSTILNTALPIINTYSTVSVAVTDMSTNLVTTTNLITTPTAYTLPNLLTNVVFGLTTTTKPANGIYKFTFTTVKNGLTEIENFCVLVDSGLLCNLKADTDKFLMFLILKETYQCTCECDKLYSIFKTATSTYGETDCNC